LPEISPPTVEKSPPPPPLEVIEQVAKKKKKKKKKKKSKLHLKDELKAFQELERMRTTISLSSRPPERPG
jgi:hypothetical protein